MEDLDIKFDCGRGPGNDGGINKPRFLASGDPYKQRPNSTAFFARAASTMLCGLPRSFEHRTGAVHSWEPRDEVKSKPLSHTGPAFRPSGAGPGLFSRTSGLGPANRPAVQVDPRAGGALKVGACRPAQRSPTRPMALPSPIRTAKFTNFAPTFKSGGPAGDFFDNSMYMAGPGGSDGRRTTARRPPGGKWYPGGKGGRPFSKRPEHLPDPYAGSHIRFRPEGMYYGKEGCMERAVKGPQMLTCVCWSRACPPVEWGEAKAEEMYAKRVAARGNFVYSIMPVNQVPKSLSGRIGKVVAVK